MAEHPLAEVWNKHCGGLPKVRGVSGQRLRSADARWRENPRAQYWINVIAKIRKSSFCAGRNDRGWRANFDFLIRPLSAIKVLEGKYDDPPPRYGENPEAREELPKASPMPDDVRARLKKLGILR